MKLKTLVFLGVIGVGAVWVGAAAWSKQNQLFPLDNIVNEEVGKYQSQLQRRADLIPNLADIVKGYMTSEQKTMIDTAAARSGEISKLRPSDIANNPEAQKKLIEAQAAAGRAVVAINATREAYPELKASKQIDSLMAELAGTENRINVARGNVQRVIGQFNATAGLFPGNMIAKLVGYPVKPFFQTAAENQNAPKLNFSK